MTNEQKEFINTSGKGNTIAVPNEVKKFNWGAFGFNWLWGIFNK